MQEQEPSAHSILVVDTADEDRERARSALQGFFPAAEVDAVPTVANWREYQGANDFDIIVLDYDLSQETSLAELIYQLKMEDYEPSVVVVSKNADAGEIAALYKFGCHRCIVKEEGWIDELGSAVDYLIRLRKAKKENLNLRAKLTEANMLLQEKNKRLDEFSATVAHDIRGPLGGIMMRLEYILDTYEEGVDDRLRQLLSRAFQSAERLTDLVQSMYEYAKLGSQATKMKYVNLNVLIEEVIEDLHFDEELEIKIVLDDLPIIWGSTDLLRRVFINLINNAVKYNDKPEIIISLGSGEVEEKILAPFASIYVKDNGAGIAAEELDNIFHMFSRGQRAEDYAGGSGVGLAVAKRIVELHYGSLSVESELGQGTTFTLSLPLRKVDLLDESESGEE